MAKILFVVRKSKAKADRYILYCRVTISGQTREFSTEETIYYPDKWDQARQFYDLPGDAGTYVNLLVDKLRYHLKTICMHLSSGTATVTPDAIIRKFKTPVEKPVQLKDIVRLYIDYAKAEIDLSPGTLRHYENYLKNLITFGSNYVYEVNLQWAERFKKWLRAETGAKKTRPSRHVEFFNKALKHAAKLGTVKENGLVNYVMERDKEKPLVYLERDEAIKFITADFKNKQLREVTHLFIYQGCTGVEYCNIWAELELRDKPGIGKIWAGKRGKNKNPFFIPYDEMAAAILARYNGKLPYYDNSTYNKTLRHIAEFLGIEKHITSHVGRKTFSMAMEANGWSRGAIQLMLGHKSIRTTETHYLTASPVRLENEMIARQ